ncbi:DUF2934 domain-containing protein [Aureimonas leprariae]|uniref:DUF2934 domain-containing protein n=1 Tax=Plantimonas leprariae TaxID=2615207 RepID=UPI00192A4A31|nr:DUF2934 domain-containing protein [Aureimonas leprariae]
MKNDDEERIRQEAHRLWEAEGRPDGRADRHWAEAREIVALRDSMGSTLKPVQDTLEEPAEPALAAENLGDLPGMTDQGDEKLAPSLDAARDLTDEQSLSTDKDRKKEKAKAPAAKAKAADKSKAKTKAATAKAPAKGETKASKRKSA